MSIGDNKILPQRGSTHIIPSTQKGKVREILSDNKRVMQQMHNTFYYDPLCMLGRHRPHHLLPQSTRGDLFLWSKARKEPKECSG